MIFVVIFLVFAPASLFNFYDKQSLILKEEELSNSDVVYSYFEYRKYVERGRSPNYYIFYETKSNEYKKVVPLAKWKSAIDFNTPIYAGYLPTLYSGYEAIYFVHLTQNGQEVLSFYEGMERFAWRKHSRLKTTNYIVSVLFASLVLYFLVRFFVSVV